MAVSITAKAPGWKQLLRDTPWYRAYQAVLCKGSAGCAQAHSHGKAAPPPKPVKQTGIHGLKIGEGCTGVFLSSAP